MGTDVGLALLEARTEPMVAAHTGPIAAVPATRPYPVVRPVPARRYPPPVPARPDAVTTLIPAVRA